MIYVLGLLVAACVATVIFIWRLPSSDTPGLKLPVKPDTRFKRLEERVASLESEFKRTYQSLILEKEGKIDSAQLELKRQKLAELEKELDKANRDNLKFQKERDKQVNVITQLNKQLADLKKQLQALNSELREIKKREQTLKDKLFKQKIMYADNESELQQIQKENENLRNELEYEKSY